MFPFEKWAGVVCGVAAGVCVGCAELREDPAKYWDVAKFQQAPAYRPSPFEDCKDPDLQDILFDGVPYKGKPAPVFAYIAYPKTPMPEGGYPGILLIHGGGGTAYPYFAKLWASRGFAVLMIDWYNSRPLKNAVEKRNKKSSTPLEGGRRNDIITNVSNMILAHSLLRSLPKVNPDRTVFVGLSWGSWYGTAVAALDDRFKGAVEIYCGDLNQGPRKAKFLLNGRFVHAAKIPMYWVCSTNDANVTLNTLQASWDACPKLVNKSVVVRLPHSHVGFRFDSCFRMAHHFAEGAPALPVVGQMTVRDGVATAKVLSRGKGLIKTIFCYTADGEDVAPVKRKWVEIPAKLKGDELSVKLPEGIRQGFFSAYDEESRFRDCCGSSNVVNSPAAGK